MAKLKQIDLFEEDHELLELCEREKQLREAQKQAERLPEILAHEKHERDSTMPPMAEILEREEIQRFEQSLSRGQVENILRTQRHSLALMLLLAVATTLMLLWAYKIAVG
ncbi:hypothetical protein [Luteolibacter sp. AS25]|uniref:hypothetical protein n=1 Tax=Luteolibacter sp. AS25 TaxID=3135776 RepID=UPI00398A8A33